MTEKGLLSGEQFEFNNELWCEENLSDDFRMATLWFDNSPGWRGGFKLFFNGGLLGSFKTFTGLENRMRKLSDKWHLNF